MVVGGLPFNHVTTEGFISYTKKLVGEELIIRGRTFFTEKLEKLYHSRRFQLMKVLEKANHVATTADCWSSKHRKKYLGETVHWFDENLKRKSGCLAIRRIVGSTTYLVLAKLLESIHCEYNISQKTVMFTTDNGSNFLKAAKQFSEHSGAPEFDEENCDEQYDETVFLELNTILENIPPPSSLPRGTLPIYLPPHSKCGCHLFNLICTVDVAKIDDPTFKSILESVEDKCTKLCKAQNYSDNTSDFIRQELGGLFVKPNDTRWNSGYNSKHRVYRYLQKKPSELNKVMTHLKIALFQRVETEFLSEYLKIMKEMVDILDILQGDQHIGMGFLLPALAALDKKLLEFKEDPNIKYCFPLMKSLQSSTNER